MHRRLLPCLVALCALALLLPVASASAASRMLVGFMDDGSFRWDNQRMALLDQAEAANGQMIRTLVNWRDAAPTRPANPANPFDPAYHLDDVDELVRGAQLRGMEVLISIWAAPAWANGGRSQNYGPRKPSDLGKFAQALAARYSGRYAGYPAVQYFSYGNESNLEMFFAPQYNKRGKSVGPQLYARDFRAAYKGFKRGNRAALVAIGETSPQGRDKPSPGRAQDSHSPGRFAQLVSKARPRVKFDAWAHHPYPTRPGLSPTQRVRWPNVTLPSMSRFERSLDRWFHRRHIPIWITEYGHETKPPGPNGVSLSKQKRYATQALNLARRDPRVEMFTWFVLEDRPGNPWSSGLLNAAGARKPAFSAFAKLAGRVDGRNPSTTISRRRNPTVTVPVLELAARNPFGARVGVTYRVFDRKKGVAVGQPFVKVSLMGNVSFRAMFKPVRRHTYRVAMTIEDVNGVTVRRTAWLHVK